MNETQLLVILLTVSVVGCAVQAVLGLLLLRENSKLTDELLKRFKNGK